MTTTDRLEPFEVPALWRAEIIASFRLRGAERCAAASPAPGFPQILDSTLDSLPDLPKGVWLDVGGGLGGVASWIERTRRRDAVVVDMSIASLRAAGRLFPNLPRAAATARQLPVRSGSVAVAFLNGVISLLDDLEALFAELWRVLHADGAIVVTDLWSCSSRSAHDDPNTFWSIEDVRSVAAAHGFVESHVAVGAVTTGWWSSAAEQVNDEIVARYAGCAEYDAWRDDQAHVEAVMSSGTVLPAGLVLRTRR